MPTAAAARQAGGRQIDIDGNGSIDWDGKTQPGRSTGTARPWPIAQRSRKAQGVGVAIGPARLTCVRTRMRARLAAGVMASAQRLG
jgi:hypothetical protein